MRSLELHASAKTIQRSAGRSSVAAAAYRSGERLTDERTGLVHDYTKKGGVEFSRLYLPDNAPDDLRGREALWNAVERKENRSNSCTARELEIAFPYEFNAMQRREAGDTVCRELMRRYGCAVDSCFHAPNKQGDERNFHAHILFTDRGFDPSTIDGWAKKKYRDLSNDRITVDGEKTTRGKQEILALRAFTADTMNQIATRDKLDVKVEHLSFEARGIDREPTVHMGVVANDMERNDKPSDLGDINRAIDDRNQTVAVLHGDSLMKTIDEFDKWKTEQEKAFDRQLILDSLDDTSKRKAEDDRYQKDLKTYQKPVKTINKQINTLNERLERKGIGSAWRKLTGKTRKDRERLEGFREQINYHQERLDVFNDSYKKNLREIAQENADKKTKKEQDLKQNIDKKRMEVLGFNKAVKPEKKEPEKPLATEKQTEEEKGGKGSGGTKTSSNHLVAKKAPSSYASSLEFTYKPAKKLSTEFNKKASETEEKSENRSKDLKNDPPDMKPKSPKNKPPKKPPSPDNDR